MKNLSLRFWEKVDIRNDDDCWEWQAGRSRRHSRTGEHYRGRTEVMINTHTPFSLAIAAFVARYALVSIPGTELSDGAQGVNQSPIDLAFELSERQLGATIGFPALVYDASDVQRDLTPLIDTHGTVEDLREQLATADEATGQSIAAMELAWELADCYHVIGADGDASDVLQARRRSEEILTQLDTAIVAARAWLRRS